MVQMPIPRKFTMVTPHGRGRGPRGSAESHGCIGTRCTPWLRPCIPQSALTSPIVGQRYPYMVIKEFIFIAGKIAKSLNMADPATIFVFFLTQLNATHMLRNAPRFPRKSIACVVVRACRFGTHLKYRGSGFQVARFSLDRLVSEK